jgi:hypothetical protein
MAAAFGVQAQSVDLDISTTNAAWRISAGGATDALAFHYFTDITVTSSGHNSGLFLPGGNYAAFDGFWVAHYYFTLPSNAAYPSLIYSNLFGDDRVVLRLNGNVIGSTGISLPTAPRLALMVLSDGEPAQTWAFGYPNRGVGGTNFGGFKLGGTNVLEAVVNNTPYAEYTPFLDTLSPTNGTFFGVRGAVSYTLTPPRLAAMCNGDSVSVQWPADAQGYVLQTTADMTDPSSWQTISSTANACVFCATNSSRFFRLIAQ